MKKLLILQCLIVLCQTIPAVSLAGIQLNGTRVIYPAGEREVTLGLTNHATEPRLLQTWVDAGDDNANAAPFIVMPPIFRLDADKGQTLRIIYTGGALPQDRESVFWLNVLEIRPKQTGEQVASDTMKISIRSRVKLFYRPKNLSGSPGEAASLLHWRIVPAGKGYALTCENPTAFNVSFSHVGLKGAPLDDKVKQSGMCPAKGKESFTVSGTPDAAKGLLILKTIDDLGGYHNSEARFSR